jgi:hypothetical protein
VSDYILIDCGERAWLQVEVGGRQRLSFLGRVNLESLRCLAKSRGVELVETFERVQGADGLWAQGCPANDSGAQVSPARKRFATICQCCCCGWPRHIPLSFYAAWSQSYRTLNELQAK